MTITFGTLKHPAYERHIVEKRWVGAGYDLVPPRKPLGMCMHKWWGYGDALSLVRLFGPGGERHGDALTDYSITHEGALVMLNDPWGTRSPYANGPANDLEGDGPLFIRKLGVGAVNARLVSVEFEGKDEPLTEAQLAVGSDLWAYMFDQARVPYTEYPNNPNVGCVTDLQHWEIGPKECPFAGARSQTNVFQDRVRGKLKAAQTGGAVDPIPPVNPPTPDHNWLPDGLTEAQVIALFGTGTRFVGDMKESFGFDPNGVISNAWLARAAKDRAYPGVEYWWQVWDTAREISRNTVSFANGWVLIGSSSDRSSWKWM